MYPMSLHCLTKLQIEEVSMEYFVTPTGHKNKKKSTGTEQTTTVLRANEA